MSSKKILYQGDDVSFAKGAFKGFEIPPICQRCNKNPTKYLFEPSNPGNEIEKRMFVTMCEKCYSELPPEVFILDPILTVNFDDEGMIHEAD